MLFFFQAEDGIRDLTVTGVQTCALPILSPRSKTPLSASSTFLSSSATRPAAANFAFPRSQSLSTRPSTSLPRPPPPSPPTRKFLEDNKPLYPPPKLIFDQGGRLRDFLKGG